MRRKPLLIIALLVVTLFLVGVIVYTSQSIIFTTSPKKFIDDYTEKSMYIKQATDILPMYKTGTVVILDVRSPDLRTQGYITGSIHIPLTELLERIKEIPFDKVVAVYCVKNINAAYAVAILNMKGYDAYILENGIEAWLAASGKTTLPCPPSK